MRDATQNQPLPGAVRRIAPVSASSPQNAKALTHPAGALASITNIGNPLELEPVGIIRARSAYKWWRGMADDIDLSGLIATAARMEAAFA
jgi:hypothetical protein